MEASDLRNGGEMATIISIIAVIISLSSLGFNIYQNRHLHSLRKYEKANSVIRHSLELRKKLQDLKHKIDCTDDFPDCEKLIKKLSVFSESEITGLAQRKITSIHELFEIEKWLLEMELEIDLLRKQVDEQARWNEEVRKHEEKTTNHRGVHDGP